MRTTGPSDQKRGFQIHAFIFVASMIVLAIINYITGPDYYWVLWVLLSWGIGVIAHWWFVLGPGARKPEEAGDRQR